MVLYIRWEWTAYLLQWCISLPLHMIIMEDIRNVLKEKDDQNVHSNKQGHEGDEKSILCSSHHTKITQIRRGNHFDGVMM